MDPDRVLALLRSAPNRYRLTPDHKLYAKHPFQSPAALFDAVRALLAQILPPDSRSPIPNPRRKR